MPNRPVTMMVVLLVVAAAAFSLSLWSLGIGDDLMALLLCILGALSLRGLHLAVRVSANGGRR